MAIAIDPSDTGASRSYLDSLARQDRTAIPASARQLTKLLISMHGPTTSVGQTMSCLVTFPTQVQSLADAVVLDLTVDVSTSPKIDMGATARVDATVRYSTAATLHEACAFYLGEFESIGASYSPPLGLDASPTALVQGSLNDEYQTRYRVGVQDRGRLREIKITVTYQGFDHAATFDRFCGWHDGIAPVADVAPSSLEISTFAGGRRSKTLALLTTTYACETTTCAELREIVEQRLSELNLSYAEPRDGLLFLRGGPFEAETHLLEHGDGSALAFVGEFELS